VRPARAALAAAVAALSACSPGGADRAAAERAIKGYNEGAILAYRTRDFEPLKRFATEAEWGRVVVLVDLKTANRVVLESELLSLEVGRVEPSGPDGLAAETRERWRYYDRPVEPGGPRGTTFVADMKLQYQLVRSQGSPWRVERVKQLENEFIEPKGFQLHQAGHGAAPAGAPRAAHPPER
jgi:hypothetical protein